MAEPSLNEILSITGSSGNQAGTPAVVFDNSQLINTITTAAHQKSANDIQRYHLFLDNLNNLSQDANAIAGMDIMPQDRDLLDKQANEIFTLASKNPNALSGRGAEGIALREKLAKWKSDATRSKQNYTFDYAHRQLLEQNPSFNTEENKKMLEDFGKTPLSQRKEFLINTPTQLDLSSLSKGILDSPFIKQKYAEKSDDGQFIKEGTRTKYKPYIAGLEAAFTTTPDVRTWAKERYNDLPKSLQQQYTDKTGNPDYKSLWLDLGKGLFVSDIDLVTGEKKDIETVDRIIQNPFKLAEQKAATRLTELAKEFDYNKRLEGIRIAGRVSVEKMREKARLQPLKQRKKWLQKTSDLMLDNALVTGKDFDTNGLKGKILDASSSTLKLFGGVNALGKPDIPNGLIVNPDKSLTSVYYSVGKDGQIKMSEQQKSKSKTFSEEEFKARFGKDILGAKEVGQELSDTDIDIGENTDDVKLPPDDNEPDQEPEVESTVNVSTLKDGSYKIKDGKNKGKTVTIKGGKVLSLK